MRSLIQLMPHCLDFGPIKVTASSSRIDSLTSGQECARNQLAALGLPPQKTPEIWGIFSNQHGRIRKRYSEEQVVKICKEVEAAGKPAEDNSPLSAKSTMRKDPIAPSEYPPPRLTARQPWINI